MLKPNNWIDNYGDALFAFALKRLNNNEAQSEDIVQEVFFSAWKNRESYNGTASEKTWLYTICKNKIIDFYRKQNKTQFISLDNNEEDETYFTNDGHIQQAYKSFQQWGDKADDNIGNKEFYNILNNCKSKLKKIQEQIFSLKYLEDVDSSEICALLGISSQNYWVLMHRAKMQLRVCIEKNWITK